MNQEQRVVNRKKMCIKEIKEMDKEITSETVKLGVLALGVGIGFIGVMYFGYEILDVLIFDNEFNLLSMGIDVDKIFMIIKLLISGDISFTNLLLFKEKLGVISADIEYKKYYQRELENLCTKSKIRVRKRVDDKNGNKA